MFMTKNKGKRKRSENVRQAQNHDTSVPERKFDRVVEGEGVDDFEDNVSKRREEYYINRNIFTEDGFLVIILSFKKLLASFTILFIPSNPDYAHNFHQECI